MATNLIENAIESQMNRCFFLTHLAADTIFMDWVIFWMFLTDLSRIEMAFNVAILRFCWANAPFEMIALITGVDRCIHMIDLKIYHWKKKKNKMEKICQKQSNSIDILILN